MKQLCYILFLNCISILLSGQNKTWKSETDFRHNFALYLKETNQLKLASRELKTLDNMHPNVDSIRLFLVDILKEDGAFQEIKDLLTSWQSEDSLLFLRQTPLTSQNNLAGNLYFQSKLISTFELGDYNFVINLLEKHPTITSTQYNNNFQMASYLALKDWKSAQLLAEQVPAGEVHQSLLNLSERSKVIKQKNPYLAASMSTLIPGTGKVYANKWKDGLFSFIFVASNAFVSYRGFNRSGIESPFGWIFGTVGFSFYISNIYGSFREAKKFNKRQSDQIANKAHENLRHLY